MRNTLSFLVVIAYLFSPRLGADDLPPDLPDDPPDAVAETTDSNSRQPASTEAKRWFVLLPAFVVHGLDPTGGANRYMPRRITGDGRAVATPGLGFEYQGHSSFEAAVAFVKDCYDNAAGTMQIGQHWRWREAWDFGYSVGLYIRQTPIACYTSTVTTTAPATNPPGVNLGGGRRAQPARTNTLSTTQCAFQDNLPFRYTTRVGKGYMDVIPTPFLHASVRLYHGAFDLHLMTISNFYLNEVLLSIPF